MEERERGAILLFCPGHHTGHNNYLSINEVVQKYAYLKPLQFGRNNFEDEVNRRIQLSWAAFGKLRQILSLSTPQTLKTKVSQCVLPVMTYGAETWTLTVLLPQVLGVSLRD
jgi:hypothetical protein